METSAMSAGEMLGTSEATLSIVGASSSSGAISATDVSKQHDAVQGFGMERDDMFANTTASYSSVPGLSTKRSQASQSGAVG